MNFQVLAMTNNETTERAQKVAVIAYNEDILNGIPKFYAMKENVIYNPLNDFKPENAKGQRLNTECQTNFNLLLYGAKNNFDSAQQMMNSKPSNNSPEINILKNQLKTAHEFLDQKDNEINTLRAMKDKGQNTQTAVLESLIKQVSNNLSNMPKTVIIQPNGKKEYVEGITHEKFGRVLRYVARGLDVFLSGPAGTGKSELARQVAKALGRNFYQASTVTQEHKLTGFLDMKNDYRETQFYKAVKYGGVFCFEELDSCSSEVVVGFNTALSQREFDFGNNELVKAHKDFVVIATGNTTGRGGDEVYTGRTVIDGSSLDRYKNVTIDYSPAIENVIVKGNTEFLEFVHSLRKATKETEIHLIFSYRSMARLLESEQLDSDILELWEMLDEDLIKGMASDDLEQLVANMEINRNNKYFQALRELSQNC